MAHTMRFMFSDEDRARILANVLKLLQDHGNSTLSEWNELTELYRKRIRLSLHASTLTQYCEDSHIPRGLRIQKGPSLFNEREELRNKWIAILNKCSFDLMLLFIEESLKDTVKLTQDIELLEDKL